MGAPSWRQRRGWVEGAIIDKKTRKGMEHGGCQAGDTRKGVEGGGHRLRRGDREGDG